MGWLLVAAIAIPAGAQAVSAQTSFGGIVGFVFQCTNGQQVPVANANVAVTGGPSSGGAKSTTTGDFTISGLAPGLYTVIASNAGETGQRVNVTVGSNMVDAGDIVLGSVFGCGDEVTSGDNSPIPQAAPTFTPAAAPTSTPAPAPTPVPPPPPAAPSNVAPADTGAAPSDTGAAPADTGSGPDPATIDVPPPNTDVAPEPVDTSPDAGISGTEGNDNTP